MTLYDFLVELGKDPELVELYLKNPERAMAEKGLSEPDRDILLTGNLPAIRKVLEDAAASGVSVAWIIWFWRQSS